MEQETKNLSGKVVLVTGGTRGIGQAIARHAAELGAKVAVTFRDPAKQARAERVRRELAGSGAEVLLLQTDITSAAARRTMFENIKSGFGRLDGLVLNAAGGLEAGKGPDYAMLVNRDAQLALVNEALEAGLMSAGSWVIYMTSLWAHRWGQMESLPGYAPVARTKHRAEQDLRALIPALAEQGVRLAVVVGHLISDTGAFAIFKRKDRSLVENMASEVEGGVLPTPDEVAEASLNFLLQPDLPSGQTVYIGIPKQ